MSSTVCHIKRMDLIGILSLLVIALAIPSSLPFRSVLNQPLPPIPGEDTSAVLKHVVKPPSEPQAPPTIPARSSTKNYPEVKLKPKSDSKVPPVAPRDRQKSPAVGGASIESKLAAIVPKTAAKNPPPEPPKPEAIYTNQSSSAKAIPPRKTSTPPSLPVAAKTTPVPARTIPVLAKTTPVPAKTTPTAANTVAVNVTPVANGNEQVAASSTELAELRRALKTLNSQVESMREDSQQQMRAMKEELGLVNQTVEGLRSDYVALKKDMAQIRGQSASPGERLGLSRGGASSREWRVVEGVEVCRGGRGLSRGQKDVEGTEGYRGGRGLSREWKDGGLH